MPTQHWKGITIPAGGQQQRRPVPPPSATAWVAPGANADGYQIEHAGRAAQGIAVWAWAITTQ